MGGGESTDRQVREFDERGYVVIRGLVSKAGLPGIQDAAGDMDRGGFFREAPREMEEAALIDGCSQSGLFWRVVVPVAARGWWPWP